MSKTPITVAYGDGIGPEILDASIRILEASGAEFEIDEESVEEKVYLSGNTSGIDPKFWDSIRRTELFFKAPTSGQVVTQQKTHASRLDMSVRHSDLPKTQTRNLPSLPLLGIAAPRKSSFTRLFYVFRFSVNKHLLKDLFHLLYLVVRYPPQLPHQSRLVNSTDLIQHYPTLFPLELQSHLRWVVA